MQTSVLIVAADPRERERLRSGVEKAGRAPVECDGSVPERAPAAVLLDADADPDAVAAWSRRLNPPRRRRAAVPILAVSSARRVSEIEALLREGASDCLAKPVDPERLAWKLDRLLRARAPAANGPAPDRPDVPDELRRAFEEVRRRHGTLRDRAGIHDGALPRHPGFRRMAPPDRHWVGVLSGEDIVPFRAGKPTSYLYWHKRTLFRLPEPHEFLGEKVVVRRVGPPMAAAVESEGTAVGGDALSVVPAQPGRCGFVACALNGRVLDFYFNRLWPRGVDGASRLRPADLGEIPWPDPDDAEAKAFDRAAKFLRHYGARPASPADRRRRAELARDADERLFRLYGLGPKEQALLRDLHF